MAQIILLSNVEFIVTHARSMGAYVVASKLEMHGYDTVVIDWFTKNPDFFAYLENFLNKETIFLGISTTFLTNKITNTDNAARTDIIRHYENNESLWLQTPEELENWFRELKQLLNRYNKNCKIALGGRRSDALYKTKNHKLLETTYRDVDYCFIRLSDDSILEIIDNISKQNPLKSVTVEEKFGINFVIDPFPKTTCPITEYQPKWAIQKNEGLPIEVARGCAFNCKFCYYDKKFSYRKNNKLLKNELIKNFELFGTTSYVFRDDCFNDSVPKVMEVCETILSLPFKIRWVSYARVDLAIKFPETFNIMIESGASGLCFGVESFNYEALKKAGKGVHPDKVKDFLLNTYSKYNHTCLYHATFVIGLPGETEESLWSGIDWLVKNRCLDSATFGMLDFPDQEPEYDGFLRDYPDHVRYPEKYGFEKIQKNPMYWRHCTMDSTKAEEMSRKINSYWKATGNSTLAIMWLVPRFLSYGLSWNDILDIARNKKEIVNWYQKILKLEHNWLNHYFNELKETNTCKKKLP